MQNPVTRYILLGYNLLRLLDQGETATIDRVYAHISEGSLFPWLRGLGRDVDLSIHEAADEADVLHRFGQVAGATEPSAFGVDGNGLALLAAYCFQVLADLDRTRPVRVNAADSRS